MFSKKELLLKVSILVIAIAAGAGTLWHAKADTCSDPVTYYQDADGDGYGNPNVSQISCTQPSGYVTNNTDCDDTLATRNPGLNEICDFLDNDCDGTNNEGLATTTFYRDYDNDTYGIATDTTIWCTGILAGYAIRSGDCNDNASTTNPGAAESCNGVDDNCNGTIDEGAKTTFYYDQDGDGYGLNSSNTQSCSAPSNYVASSSDCNDSNSAVHPGATETCNGIDDDCDGSYDEGCGTLNTYYRDADGDGYGNASLSITASTQPSGYVSSTTADCNDSASSVHPGATETCNGIDDDCDGNIDEGVKTTYYYDYDNDGYGSNASSTQACFTPANYVSKSNDCNDNSASAHPGASEIQGNNIDDDCDGTIDEKATTDNCDKTNCKCCCNCTEPKDNGKNHGSRVSSWARYTNCLKWKLEITGKEKGQMMKDVVKKTEKKVKETVSKCNKGKNKKCN